MTSDIVERVGWTAELIARLEKATGPDRDLDRDIAIATFVGAKDEYGGQRARGQILSDPFPGRYEVVEFSGVSTRMAPAYTASIDAALSLVPEEDSSNFEVCLEQSKRRSRIFWDATIGHMHIDAWTTRAPTPALALCIAALKAIGATP